MKRKGFINQAFENEIKSLQDYILQKTRDLGYAEARVNMIKTTIEKAKKKLEYLENRGPG